MRTLTIASSDAPSKLMGAAEALFADAGYELTSTRHIASKAGLNLAMINYYFGSKEALYRKIFQVRLEEINISIRGIASRPLDAADKLSEFMAVYMEEARLNGSFQRMLYREILFLSRSLIPDLIENYIAENKAVFTQILEEGIASGVFRPLNASYLYLTLFSVIAMGNGNIADSGKIPFSEFSPGDVKCYLHQILLIKTNPVNMN